MEYIIERLEREYNPEFDIIRGAPMVTWADRQLLELVKGLLERIEALEKKGEER